MIVAEHQTLDQLCADALSVLNAEGLPFDELKVDSGWQRHQKTKALWYKADSGVGRTGRPWLQVSAGDARVTGGVDKATVSYRSWSRNGATYSRDDIDSIHKQLMERASQQEQSDAKRKQQAANHAENLWNQSSAEVDEHPYLVHKNVKAYGIRLKGSHLLVPVKGVGGRLHGVQTIDADGLKLFNPGCSVAGHFHLFRAPTQRMYLCEGYATAASVQEATGAAAVCCFNAGNLKPVAKVLRNAYPNVDLIICSDNDAWTDGNPGLTKAREAAAAVGASLAVPTFEDTSSKPTDFNDLHRLQGMEEVRRQLGRAEKVEKETAEQPSQDGDWPEPAPLPDLRPSVSPLDPELLPGPFRPWLEDIAERMQCPLEYPAVGAMVSLGAVIGRQIGVKPKRHDDWLEVPNLWGAVIGPPGFLKSPALTEASRPLHRMAHEARRAFEEAAEEKERDEELREARIKTLRSELLKSVQGKGDRPTVEIDEELDALKAEGEPGTCPRYIVNDSSVEKLGEILAENPNGVLLYRDELVGWLRSLDREGSENARPFFLEAWNGKGSYTYDRIGRGTIHIETACVSVLGGIQPGPLAEYVKSAKAHGRGADGLLQRMQVLVWPDSPGTWKDIDRVPDNQARDDAFTLFTRLASIRPEDVGAMRERHQPIPFLNFSGEAQEVFGEWRNELENKRLRSGDDEAVESHLSKYRKLIPTMALLCHLADGGTGPISETALLRACGWGEVLETHAYRVYGAGMRAEVVAAHALAEKILGGNVQDGFRPKEVYRKCWKGLGKDETYKAIDLLEDLDWLRTEVVKTGGRPSTVCWINPKLGTQK